MRLLYHYWINTKLCRVFPIIINLTLPLPAMHYDDVESWDWWLLLLRIPIFFIPNSMDHFLSVDVNELHAMNCVPACRTAFFFVIFFPPFVCVIKIIYLQQICFIFEHKQKKRHKKWDRKFKGENKRSWIFFHEREKKATLDSSECTRMLLFFFWLVATGWL